MKYFSPSYWFKMWLLSVPLFNDETKGINAMSIDNKKIKDWTSKNTTNLSLIKNQEATLTNNQQYNLSHQVTNQTINPFYQSYLDSIASQKLETSIHKHRHEKRLKREENAWDRLIEAMAEEKERKNLGIVLYIRDIDTLNPRISFLGSDMKQRGVLWLDTASKRIKFCPEKALDRYDKPFGTQKNIIITDENNKNVRIVTFCPNDKMSNVLRAHNLINNNDGLDYKDFYTIQVYSSQADTTWFKRNDDLEWMYNTSKGQYTETFLIVNDWLWHENYFLNKYCQPLIHWTNSYISLLQKYNNWQYSDIKNSSAAIHDFITNKSNFITALQTVQNSIKIDKLEIEINRLKERINNLENKQECSIEKVGNMIGTIGALIGQTTYISEAITIYCEIFNDSSNYNNKRISTSTERRGKRDVSVIENKFDTNFIRTINQEKYLPSNKNNTNKLNIY